MYSIAYNMWTFTWFVHFKLPFRLKGTEKFIPKDFLNSTLIYILFSLLLTYKWCSGDVVNAVGKSGETLIDSVRKYKNKTLKTRFSQSFWTEYRQSGKLSIVLLNTGFLSFRLPMLFTLGGSEFKNFFTELRQNSILI